MIADGLARCLPFAAGVILSQTAMFGSRFAACAKG